MFPLTSPTNWFLLVTPHSTSFAMRASISRPSMESSYSTIGISFGGGVLALIVSYMSIRALTTLSLFRHVSQEGRLWSHLSLLVRHESQGCAGNVLGDPSKSGLAIISGILLMVVLDDQSDRRAWVIPYSHSKVVTSTKCS